MSPFVYLSPLTRHELLSGVARERRRSPLYPLPGALFVALALLFTIVSPIHAASVLVWSDHFTTINLDASRWNVINEPSWNRSEREFYSYNNVYIAGSSLILRSDNMNGFYTSGEVNTFNRFAFRYGRVDIRARLPYGQGIWPAFWLLTTNCQMYPATNAGCVVTPAQSYGEIDIMEMLGQDPHSIYMTNHFGYYPGQNFSHQCAYTGPDYSADYHTYSIDWRPGSLIWLIDGVPRCYQNSGVPTGPMFLVMNTAIGGFFPGNPDATTSFPQFTEINYVLVSQYG